MEIFLRLSIFDLEFVSDLEISALDFPQSVRLREVSECVNELFQAGRFVI